MASPPPPYHNEKGGEPAPYGGSTPYPTGAPYQPAQPPYPPQGAPGGQPPYPPQGAAGGQPPYPPAQPGYPPQPGAYYATQGQAPVIVGQPQTTTVVLTTPVYSRMGETPQRMHCPNCRQDIVTCINYESGTLTWIICLICIFVGLFLGCCLIPFCVNACKDVVHTCPNCKQAVGRYNRLS